MVDSPHKGKITRNMKPDEGCNMQVPVNPDARVDQTEARAFQWECLIRGLPRRNSPTDRLSHGQAAIIIPSGEIQEHSSTELNSTQLQFQLLAGRDQREQKEYIHRRCLRLFHQLLLQSFTPHNHRP